MKNKKNKHTLKRRIKRLIFLCLFITITIFSSIIYSLTQFIYSNYTVQTSGQIAAFLSKELTSDEFYKKLNISSIAEIDPKEDATKKEIDFLCKIAVKNFNGFFRIFEFQPFPNSYFITINVNDVQIYNNISSTELQNLNNSENNIYSKSKVIVPISNKGSNSLGEVAVAINPKFFNIIAGLCLALCILLVLISLPIAGIISSIFTIPIIKPLEELEKKMLCLANEECEDAISHKCVTNRPLKEIESLTESTNKIVSKMKTFINLLEDQKEELTAQNEELNAQNDELIESRRKIEQAQLQIIKSKTQIENLMDNANEGFLSFGEDLLINKEYSYQCRKIFGCELLNKLFSDLLYPEDATQRNFVNSLLNRIFSEKDEGKRSIYIPLLPDEIIVDDKTINIQYKIIKSHEYKGKEDFMVILTDITDKRILESQVEQERNILKMIVKTVVNFNDFIQCTKDFNRFASTEIYEIVNEGSDIKEIIYTIFRKIHTFKGNFSQFDMINTVALLHKGEDKISTLSSNCESLAKPDLIEFLKGLNISDCINYDYKKLTEVLGEDLFNQDDIITVNKNKLLCIEKKMVSTLSPLECKLLLPDIQRLRYRSMKQILSVYEGQIERLSEKLNKLVNPLIIEGDDIQVDYERYHDFNNSLIHIFRNILDHGIETSEERSCLGKSEFGSILCSINTVNNNIILKISDDGSGIDVDKICLRAIEKHVCTPKQIEEMSYEEKLQLIFHENISTKDEVNEFSGRGIGMSAIKYEVEKLNGSITANSKKSLGTEFIIKLPFEQVSTLYTLSVQDIITPLINKTKDFYSEYIGIHFHDEKNSIIRNDDKFNLKKITSFINIKGILEGIFVITIDEDIAKIMVHNFIIDSLTDEEEKQYTEDTLAECSNIIFGNSIKQLPGLQELIKIDPPITISTNTASIKYSNASTYTYTLNCDNGSLCLAFITANNIQFGE